MNRPYPFGNYLIEKELGRGGMGVVYQALDQKLGRRVALKVLHQDVICNPEQQRRFEREAKVLANLHHRGIVNLYGIEEFQGKVFLTMELVEGKSLAEVFKSKKYGRSRLLKLFVLASEAMAYAHSQGVIHRDLKPSNIMVTEQGKAVKILDFGLAKRMTGEASLSKSKEVLGTLKYMSPEQAQGRIRHLDAQSDIFSLGTILYEALAGFSPFAGSTQTNTLHKLIFSEPTPLRELQPGIASDLEAICFKAIEKDKIRRYPSAQDFAEDLNNYLAGKTVQARPVTPLVRLSKWLQRHRAWSIAGVLVIAIIGVMLALFFLQLQAKDEKLQAKNDRLQRLEAEKEFNEDYNKLPETMKLGKEKTLEQYERFLAKYQQQRYQEFFQGWPTFSRKLEKIKARKGNAHKRIKEGFSYWQRATYSAGGQSYQVEEYQHDATGMKFVRIPGGIFMMGSDDGRPEEKPKHKVEVKEFLITKYEVTQEVWEKVMGTRPWQGHKMARKGKNYPAIYVSWFDAKKFVKKLGMRLPSESEWEYACRAGTTGKYYWGEWWDRSKCNSASYWAKEDLQTYNQWQEYGFLEKEKSLGVAPVEVGQFPPNAFGLYDIIGNVWEWCEDRYVPHYRTHPTDGSAWENEKNSRGRVVRGGCFRNFAFHCRSASRHSRVPGKQIFHLGFRCVVSP